jgi:uncharacterized protein (TIGR02453 family)
MTFTGFPRELIAYLRELGANNTREWFQAHYEDYQTLLVEPARAFVHAMGEVLPELGRDIRAEPKVRGSIFPINRDSRFARDKSPYKTYQDLWFWQGNGPSRERPGYFVRLDPAELTIGAGMHRFSDEALDQYRSALTNETSRNALRAAVNTLTNDYDVGGQTLKRIPTGCCNDDLARHTGLFAAKTVATPDEVFSAGLPDFCMAHFRRVAPLQQWLTNALSP